MPSPHTSTELHEDPNHRYEEQPHPLKKTKLVDNNMEQLQQILGRIPGLVYSWQINHETTETSFVYLNNYCLELYGVSAEEAMADNTLIINLMVEEDVPGFSAAVLESMQDLSPLDQCVRMRRKDNGKVVTIHYKSVPRRDIREDGVLYTVWDGVLMDVTNQQQQVNLRPQSQQQIGNTCSSCGLELGYDNNEQQHQSMMHVKDAALLQPMFSVDAQGRIVEWNALMVEATGFPKDQVLNKPIIDLLQPRDQARFSSFSARHQQTAAKKRTRQRQHHGNKEEAEEEAPLTEERDFQFVASDGTTRYIRVRAKVTYNSSNTCNYKHNHDGEVVSGLVFCCQDLTLMKEAQDQKDAALKLVHKERGLTEWLSHEVRNPLSVTMEALLTLKELTGTGTCSISGIDSNRTLSLTKQQQSGTSNSSTVEELEQEQECLQVMIESITYVVDLLNNMMDLDQCSQGQIPVCTAPCRVRDEILLPTYRMMKSLRAGPQHPVQLRLNQSTSNSSSCSTNDIVATVDKLRLRQVLTNLIANALKFTTTGFVEVELNIVETTMISLSAPATQQSQSLQFHVRDSGCGVMPSEYDTLFSKWEQLGTSRNGTGIGLCLCQALIKAMGGSIRLNRDYDSGIKGHPGAEFIVELPILSNAANITAGNNLSVERNKDFVSQQYLTAASSLSLAVTNAKKWFKSPFATYRATAAAQFDTCTPASTTAVPPPPVSPLLTPTQMTRSPFKTPCHSRHSSSPNPFASVLTPTQTPGHSRDASGGSCASLNSTSSVSNNNNSFPTHPPRHSRHSSFGQQASLGVEPRAPPHLPSNSILPAPKNTYFAGDYVFLIVDDEKMGRKFLKRRFSRLFPNATIDEAASGEEALALVGATNRRTYDVITMDHFMAIDEMNGDDTIRQLRLVQNDALIVGISGNDKQAEHFQAGADAFFQKPLPSDETLTATFQRYLGPPAAWKVLVATPDQLFASIMTHRLRHVSAPHFTTMQEAEKRWEFVHIPSNEVMERLAIESFDLVVFDGCQEESELVSNASVLKQLRDLASKREIVLVECSNVSSVNGFEGENIFRNDNNCLDHLYSEPHDAFPSGSILKWCKDVLPSLEEMRQSLCQALLRIRQSPGVAATLPKATSTATSTKMKWCSGGEVTTAATSLYEIKMLAAQQQQQQQQHSGVVDKDTILRT